METRNGPKIIRLRGDDWCGAIKDWYDASLFTRVQEDPRFVEYVRGDLTTAWISIEVQHPEPGEQVLAMRRNGTWDRAEIAPMYFDGLDGWYMPEGPVLLEDCPFWCRPPKLQGSL